MDQATRQRALAAVAGDVGAFSRGLYPAQALRGYQVRAARAIVEAVTRAEALPLVLLFARQAGKDEVLAQVTAFLLLRARLRGGWLVHVTPTLRPQGLIGYRRLLARLATPVHGRVGRGAGGVITLGAAGATFLSAGPGAQARGATASLLLVANEAQAIRPERWDSVFAPMTASTAAPSVFAGTPWTGSGLLARQLAYLEAHAPERIHRVAWEEVAAEVPAYGDHVRARIAQLGVGHPFIQTEYCLQPLDEGDGLLPPARQALMHGHHARQSAPAPGQLIALTLDVGGGDGGVGDDSPPPADKGRDHDATVLTVFAVDRATVADPLLGLPTYRVVDRRVWRGVAQPALYAAVRALALAWGARWLVADATGLGLGLAQFLGRALRPACLVHPFVFSRESKSRLGYAFLSLVESGRYQDYAPDGAAETGAFWAEVAACRMAAAPGPGRLLGWGAPPGGHDDLLVSAALVALLDTVVRWATRPARSRSYGGDGG